jgi:hypothetical protein
MHRRATTNTNTHRTTAHKHTTQGSTTPYLVLHPALQLLFLFLPHSGLHALPALSGGQLRVLSISACCCIKYVSTDHSERYHTRYTR